MLTLRPRHIIHEIVHRRLEKTTACNGKAGVIRRAIVVQPPKIDERLAVIVADIAETLAGKPPMEVVDQRRL